MLARQTPARKMMTQDSRFRVAALTRTIIGTGTGTHTLAHAEKLNSGCVPSLLWPWFLDRAAIAADSLCAPISGNMTHQIQYESNLKSPLPRELAVSCSERIDIAYARPYTLAQLRRLSVVRVMTNIARKILDATSRPCPQAIADSQGRCDIDPFHSLDFNNLG